MTLFLHFALRKTLRVLEIFTGTCRICSILYYIKIACVTVNEFVINRHSYGSYNKHCYSVHYDRNIMQSEPADLKQPSAL